MPTQPALGHKGILYINKEIKWLPSGTSQRRSEHAHGKYLVLSGSFQPTWQPDCQRMITINIDHLILFEGLRLKFKYICDFLSGYVILSNF